MAKKIKPRSRARVLQTQGLKQCWSCKKARPFSDFNKQSTRWDGLDPRCRPCAADYRAANLEKCQKRERESSAQRRKDNPEKSREDSRKQYAKDIERSRALRRELRKKYPEVFRDRSRRSREKDPAKANEASKLSKRKARQKSRAYDIEYTATHKEQKRESSRLYRIKHREKINRRARERREIQLLTDPTFAPRRRKSAKKYHDNNPDVIRAIRRNRKARIRSSPGKHTAQDVVDLFKIQKGKCAHPWCRSCLKSGYHVDHIIPIAKGGSNGRKNIQLLCPTCNHKKHASDPIDFARKNGMLL